MAENKDKKTSLFREKSLERIESPALPIRGRTPQENTRRLEQRKTSSSITAYF